MVKMAVFVRFMRPSCSACQESEPQWKNFKHTAKTHSVELKEVGPDESFPWNGTSYSFSSVPTYMLFMEAKEPVEFDGDRKHAPMLEFLKQNGVEKVGVSKGLKNKKKNKKTKKMTKAFKKRVVGGRSRRRAARSFF